MFLGTLRCYERVFCSGRAARSRILFRPRCTSVFCSGRRGDFRFFADGRGAAHEFGTTQDSVGPSSSRRLGEVVDEFRRRALENEAAATFDHSWRAGGTRRQWLRAGRRVHGFGELALSALPGWFGSARVSQLYSAVFERGLQLTRTRIRTLPTGWNTFEFRGYRLVLSAVVPQRSVMRRKPSDT